jgi:hypothetical protein
VTSKGALPVDCIDVTAEVFAQSKSLDGSAAFDIALERTLVGFEVFTPGRISLRGEPLIGQNLL